MPDYDHMPTAADVLTSLVADGLVLDPEDLSPAMQALDIEGQTDAAIEDFEQDTHYEPFQCSGNVEERKFDPADILFPPNRLPILDLACGLVDVEELRVGVSPTAVGKALQPNLDYYLRPSKAPLKGKPYTYIEFYSLAVGVGAVSISPAWPDSIRIKALWGYGVKVPSAAFQAVVARAKWKIYPALALQISRGYLQRQEGDTRYEFARGQATGPVRLESEAWLAQYRMGVNRYRHQVIY